jgi:cobalt-zinc-cadmium efflux system membrane fusion protein
MRAGILAGATAILVGCGASESPTGEAHGTAAAADYERGPNRGRMLRDGSFALEVTIFEDGVDPEFRVYPSIDGKPIPPGSVDLTMILTRLGDRKDRFAFQPERNFLRGQGVV